MGLLTSITEREFSGCISFEAQSGLRGRKEHTLREHRHPGAKGFVVGGEGMVRSQAVLEAETGEAGSYCLPGHLLGRSLVAPSRWLAMKMFLGFGVLTSPLWNCFQVLLI